MSRDADTEKSDGLTLQAQELPEIVQVANTPFPVGLDTHDLVQSHDMRSVPGAERSSSVLSTAQTELVIAPCGRILAHTRYARC